MTICKRPGCGHDLEDHHRAGGFIDPCDKCKCVDVALQWPLPNAFVERRFSRRVDEVTLADLQVEAIRGVVGELLSSSGSANPGVWGPQLLGQLSRILDMTEPLEVMGVLSEQMYERERDED